MYGKKSPIYFCRDPKPPCFLEEMPRGMYIYILYTSSLQAHSTKVFFFAFLGGDRCGGCSTHFPQKTLPLHGPLSARYRCHHFFRWNHFARVWLQKWAGSFEKMSPKSSQKSRWEKRNTWDNKFSVFRLLEAATVLFIPSLKLTARPLKINGWKMHFLMGPGLFAESRLNFREGIFRGF